jgi:hypothetical protein
MNVVVEDNESIGLASPAYIGILLPEAITLVRENFYVFRFCIANIFPLQQRNLFLTTQKNTFAQSNQFEKPVVPSWMMWGSMTTGSSVETERKTSRLWVKRSPFPYGEGFNDWPNICYGTMLPSWIGWSIYVVLSELEGRSGVVGCGIWDIVMGGFFCANLLLVTLESSSIWRSGPNSFTPVPWTEERRCLRLSENLLSHKLLLYERYFEVETERTFRNGSLLGVWLTQQHRHISWNQWG